MSLKGKIFEKAEDYPKLKMLRDDPNVEDDLKGYKWREGWGSQIIAKMLFKLGDEHFIESHSTYVLWFPVFYIVLYLFSHFLSFSLTTSFFYFPIVVIAVVVNKQHFDQILDF